MGGVVVVKAEEIERPMTVQVMKTKAEQSLSAEFARVEARLPGDDTMRCLRREAIGRFEAIGLPHRRIEEWKYTDLRSSVKEAYAPAVGAPPRLDAAALESALGPELSALDAIRLVFVNGAFSEQLSRFEPGRNTAYVFDPTSHGLVNSDFGWLRERIAIANGPMKEGVVALNTAFACDGALLRVERDARIAKPIHIIFVADSEQPSGIYTRNMIEIGEGAEVTLIESHVGLGNAARQTNTVTEIAVHDRARLVHAKVTSEGPHAQHVSTAVVEVGTHATYRAFQMVSSTALVRNQLFVTFQGQHSTFDLGGLTLGTGSSHADLTLVVDHAVSHCTSRELFKAVLADESRAVFQGRVIVRPDAQKTDGKQMARALMLSPSAEFDSKPELEIYADDVICGHGSTAAELDQDLLFYCQSRGIPLAEARALLIESFIGEAIDKVGHDGVRDALMARARAWLGEGVSAGH
jgi:Fe-S cluster assembly protein SufD